MPKRVTVGVVTSDKMKKTRVVQIPWLERHAKYGKLIRRRTICYVHDENEESAAGDTVEIIESRPLSKLKRWALVRVVEKSRVGTVAATPSAEGEG
jgi:small subunit ribosomal protein S17